VISLTFLHCSLSDFLIFNSSKVDDVPTIFHIQNWKKGEYGPGQGNVRPTGLVTAKV
jgi:hypothetical protein